MMQTKLAALVFMSIVCGLAAAHAMEASSEVDTIEGPPLPPQQIPQSMARTTEGTLVSCYCRSGH